MYFGAVVRKVVLQNVAFNVQGYHLLAVLASLIARVFLKFTIC